MFGVTILGNNSALPAFDRHPTSQVVTLSDQVFLVDCGEGTQMQLARYKIRWGRINYIFISHLHGDHYFGLSGLLNSMGLLNREHDLHLFGPPMLIEIINLQLRAAGTELPYTIHFHPLDKAGELVRTNRFAVSCFPTSHRIPCWGFRFEEVRFPRKVNPEKAVAHQVPASFFDQLKVGDDYSDSLSGITVPNELVTDAAPAPRSYAYCADTRFNTELIPHIAHCDMIYHETTYLAGLEERAAARYHSTTIEAARTALLAGAGRLLIGHFSSKYDNLEKFESEAREIFPSTDLALEGVTYPIVKAVS